MALISFQDINLSYEAFMDSQLKESSHLDGLLEFNCYFIKKENDSLPIGTNLSQTDWHNEPDGTLFIIIPEISFTIPIGPGGIDHDIITEKINNWIHPKTRGVQITSEQVLKKLKRLGYTIVKYTGSHAQLKKDGTGYKVTVPIHKGTIPKGTFKSILNQLNMDFAAFNAI